MLTPSQENYLEAICLMAEDGPVRPGKLAARLGLSMPSISRAIRGLAAAGLVSHQPYGRIEPTADGWRVGREIIARDDLLTRLLTSVLGMSPADADPHVHQLEHLIEEDVLERLEVLVEFFSSHNEMLEDLQTWIKRRPRRRRASRRHGRVTLHAGRLKEKE